MSEETSLGFVEANFSDRTGHVQTVAQRFYDGVLKSGRYAWIGVSRVRINRVVEQTAIYLSHRQNWEVGNVNVTFLGLELTEATRLGANPVDVYYLRDMATGKTLPERVIESMKARYTMPGQNLRPRVTWEQDLL